MKFSYTKKGFLVEESYREKSPLASLWLPASGPGKTFPGLFDLTVRVRVGRFSGQVQSLDTGA
ncbi:hypothetical protein [Modicisalibacter radicis]|uniref:hypothetical protein n=1 Tax=Halomonas sp. EAR18 TaxID=2518972 RepID=UPI00109CBFCB|nr:hypothetical protein [Halomonas sp. EAR18]